MILCVCVCVWFLLHFPLHLLLRTELRQRGKHIQKGAHAFFFINAITTIITNTTASLDHFLLLFFSLCLHFPCCLAQTSFSQKHKLNVGF
jgi:hypothetical protein